MDTRGGGVALGADGGGVVNVCFVFIGSRSMEIRPLGCVVWLVFVVFVLLDG